MKCPCHSGKLYLDCCQSYHEGLKKPENAMLLMRSRYAAYALELADYLIATTHRTNPAFKSNRAEWTKEILLFSRQTKFQNLKIHDHSEAGDEAFVTFTAYLKQGRRDISFTEKSRFKKVRGKWVYVDFVDWKQIEG